MDRAQWAEPDASSFMVRGPQYLSDKLKMPAARPEFRCVAVDLFQNETDEPYFNIATHPHNRVAQALARGSTAWTFVLSLHIPGPPFFTFVHYFALEGGCGAHEGGATEFFARDTPFARTARPFLFGDDDALRDNTFKLIPKCVEANFIVKRAVGGTPAILGKKLKQTYYRADHYFEVR